MSWRNIQLQRFAQGETTIARCSHRPSRRQLTRRILAFAFGCGVLVFCASCERTRDVTNDPSFGNFAAIVGVWRTRSSLYVQDVKGELYLCTDKILYNVGDQNLETVPAGTEIRIEHLYYDETFETSNTRPVGILVSGGYAGRSLHLADELFLFTNRIHVKQWAVAPDKLEKVEPATTQAK